MTIVFLTISKIDVILFALLVNIFPLPNAVVPSMYSTRHFYSKISQNPQENTYRIQKEPFIGSYNVPAA